MKTIFNLDKSNIQKYTTIISLLFIVIFSINIQCAENKKMICISNEGEHNLYLKFDKLKKVGRILPAINILVDLKSEFDGKSYYRVNNNYWLGNVPDLNTPNMNSSLWINVESCKFHIDQPFGIEGAPAKSNKINI